MRTILRLSGPTFNVYMLGSRLASAQKLRFHTLTLRNKAFTRKPFYGFKSNLFLRSELFLKLLIPKIKFINVRAGNKFSAD